MGSGSSKYKNGAPPPKGGAKNVVVAEVMVPNKSEPVRITGELNEAPPANGSVGTATLKEVGHNKFSLQMGDKSIGTFEALDTGKGGDFSSYLANTATLTIKNIETVGEDGNKMASNSNNDTMVIQLGDSLNKDYEDEVEWEEVIQTVEETPKKKKSAQKIDLNGTDRKAQLEEALQNKQANLSEQEYEQMIANHRQEVELMGLLREKEKERQKFSLASKVAARKKKRKAKQTDGDGGGNGSKLDLQSTARYQELQEQIAQQKAQMELALEQQKGMSMGNESEKILEDHKKKMAGLEAELKKEQEKRSEVLNVKLAERKKRRKARKVEKEEQMRLATEAKAQQEDKDIEDSVSAERIQADIDAKKAAFQREVEGKKAQLSADEYKRLLVKHEAEIAEMSRKANVQRMRQDQNLQDKLDARRRKRDGVNTEKVMTAAELQRMEAELKACQAQFETEMKEKRGTVSQAEYKRLIAAHKLELADLQTHLDGLRDRQQDSLLDKLAARRAKRSNKKEEQELIAKLEAQTVAMTNPEVVSKDPTLQDAMSADEIKELQLAISRKDMNFKKKLKEIKASQSKADAQKFVDQHRLDMELMQQQLDLEKARMKAVLMAKLQARRKKGGASNEVDEIENPAMSAEEIKQLQVILDQKSSDFKNRQKSAKKDMSAADLFKFMDEHQRDMEGLEKRLALERLRMEQNIKDKMAARRFRRPGSSASVESQDKPEDVEKLEQEMMVKESTFLAEVESRKSKMSKEEYERLLAQHRREMEELQKRMDRAKGRQMMHFQDKLDARRRKRQMWKNEEEERMRLMKLLNDKSEPLSKDEFNDVTEDILNYDEAVLADIQEKKGKVSSKEHQKMLDDHKKNVAKLEQTLIEKGKGKNEEINGIKEEMGHQEAVFFSKVEQKKSTMAKEEYERLLKQHQEEMEDLKKRLGWAKGRQARHLQDKLDARRSRRKMLGNEEEERKRLMEQLAKVDRLSGEELEELEDSIDFYDISVTAVIESKKGKVSDAEYNQMKAEHKKNMESMNSSLEQKRTQFDIRNTEKSMTKGKGQAVQVAVIVDGESDVDSDEEDVDVDLIGLDPGQLAVFTSTNLWTTPTQSNDVVIVPLKEEYPSKRKRDLFTDPSIFRQIDAHAIKLAQTVSLVTQPSFSSLVNELTEFGTNELQKVRLISRWLTAQNCGEMDLNDVIDDTPLGVLKGLYHKKITFSTLFMRMCRYIGLQCVEIVGIAKVKGYRAGQFISPKEPEFQHTWNSVRIDGYWHFVDCNWGVSHIAGSMTYDPFRFEYDEHYFLADPDVIISSHFPNDPVWQLLQSPLTLDDFNVQVLLKPDFFQFGFSLKSHKSVIVDVPNGDLNVQIQCPTGFILSCRLSTVEGDRDVAASGVPFDLYEFIHQVGDELMACYVRIPEAGQFYLTMYARRQYLDGELNIESYTEICRYLVRCHTPSRDIVPLPYSPADHWGPIGTMSAGLVPITHTSGVVVSADGSDFTIRFKRTQPLAFTHTLTSYGVDERQLVRYGMQRVVDDELVFTVTPPSVGRYALHINVHYSGLPQPSHLCSYMLVAHQARQKVLPIPTPEHNLWGATQAFQMLGLTAFTNPDALIVTGDPATEIIVGTQSRMFLTHQMMYSGQDITKAAQVQFGDGFVTFTLQLPYSGYFYFKLSGKETQDPSIPSTLLFNYLIRKD